VRRDRFEIVFDRSDETSARRPRRIEVITGPERRRDWPEAEKIAIVAKALEPGVNVSEIARRHDLNPQQLFGWRRRFRAEAEALIEENRMAGAIKFPPVVLAATSSSPPAATAPVPEGASIEISIGAATVRMRGPADAKTLAAVLKALRALA
jgi:transposase